MMGKRFLEYIFPLKRETTQEDESINVRFIAGSRTRGTIRLVSGMVNANRPWEMFPAFIKVLVIAFTTGSYALVFPTLWTLSSYYTNFRLILLMVIAILALRSEDESINVRFIAGSRTRGTIRLVSGMVNANRPWEMFPAFIKVLVIAFTTGSYALVFPTLWTLSSYYTNFRLILLMVIAILAL